MLMRIHVDRPLREFVERDSSTVSPSYPQRSLPCAALPLASTNSNVP